MVLWETAFGLFIARHEKGPPKKSQKQLSRNKNTHTHTYTDCIRFLLLDRPDILMMFSLLRFFSLYPYGSGKIKNK